MPLHDYEIAAGWSQSTRSNIEDLIRDALSRPLTIEPLADPVPDGSIARVTLDGATQMNGSVIITWRFSALPYAGFAALVTKALGSMTATSGQVSIKTRTAVNTFATYNAMLAKPQPSVDYQRRWNGNLLDVVFTFRNLIAF